MFRISATHISAAAVKSWMQVHQKCCRTGSTDSGSFPLKWNHHSSQQQSRTFLCLILSNNCISHGAGLCELGWNTDISLQTTIKLLMLGASAMLPWFPACLLHTRAWPAHLPCVSLTYTGKDLYSCQLTCIGSVTATPWLSERAFLSHLPGLWMNFCSRALTSS